VPKLSMFKPEKGNNYKFIDRQISRMFQVGGTSIYVHKYLGPQIATSGSPDQPIYSSVTTTNIQDMLLLENRDRHYDPEIYRIRGYYNVQNIDFNLSQFGMFIDNDTLYMTVHINDFINYVGRKPISGDVLELPHLKDDFALNDFDFSLPRYYVIEDVGRASEGFSATWYPHLYRLRTTKMTDSQQFAEILDLPAGENTSVTIRDLISTRARELEINDAVINQADADAPFSGYETRQFYTLAIDSTGSPIIETASDTIMDASNSSFLASENNGRPVRSGYTGYLVGDGFPVNGYYFGTGIQFPDNAVTDDFFLRTDFLPNRLFRFDGIRWNKVEDAVRMSMTNFDTRRTLKTSFINNTEFTYHDKVSADVVNAAVGDIIINTHINVIPALYVVLKLETTKLEYVIADNPDLLTTHLVNGVEKLTINLPVVNTEQQTIPYTGAWTVSLYNFREAQKQSLSKALRPEANF